MLEYELEVRVGIRMVIRVEARHMSEELIGLSSSAYAQLMLYLEVFLTHAFE